MPKTITSPVKKWPGSVTLTDPMTLSQASAWEIAVKKGNQAIQDGSWATYNYTVLPAIFACVEKWDLKGLENVTPDTFPLKPHKDRIALVSWLMKEITELYKDTEVPNE